ncbi:MAG: prolyl oligopeptidase family serine peptidase [Caulobacteraceae bacterium]
MRLASVILAATTAFALGARAQERPVHAFLDVALSPDGAHVASVSADMTSSGALPSIRRLVIRQTDGGGDVAISLPCAPNADCQPGALAWTRDSKQLAFTLRAAQGHGRTIWRVNADGAGLKQLLDFDGTLNDLRYDAGGRLTVLAVAGAVKEVGATQAGGPITGEGRGPPLEQRIAVLAGDRLEFVSPPDLFVYEYAEAPDGSFVGTAAPGDGDNNWWTAKLYSFTASGAQVIHMPASPQEQIAHPSVSPDGRTVAFIGGLMSDFGSTGGNVFVLPIEGGPARNVTPVLAASATAIGFGCDGALLARLLAGDETQIVRIRKDGGAQVLWRGQESLSGANGGVAPACPSGVTAQVHQSFTAPPEIEVGPIGGWKDITHANQGLTAPFTARSLAWKNGPFNVQGWLLIPANAPAGAKLPLITDIHGGPAAAATPRFVGAGLDRTLLAHGYALFLPNPRGSFGQGEAFTQANVRDFGYGDLSDIMTGIDAAIAAAPIDPGRLGVMGGSYGGYMTMWTVTQTHRFKAAMAAAGISNWQSYYGQNGIDQWMIPYFGKSVYDDPAVYARSAPITFIKNVTTPTLEWVGAQDIECPYPQTQEFWHALHDLGVPTQIIIYPGEGHGLRAPSHVADAERRTLEWFDRYLK